MLMKISAAVVLATCLWCAASPQQVGRFKFLPQKVVYGQDVDPPEGAVAKYTLKTPPGSAQNYICNLTDPNSPKWITGFPTTCMGTDDKPKAVCHVFTGGWKGVPIYEVVEQPRSSVTALSTFKTMKSPVGKGNADWKLLNATYARGDPANGNPYNLVDVDFVARVNTSSGLPDISLCDKNNKRVAAPFNAVYVFYVMPKGDLNSITYYLNYFRNATNGDWRKDKGRDTVLIYGEKPSTRKLKRAI